MLSTSPCKPHESESQTITPREWSHPVDADDKKTALRMIPYGLYVLAAETAQGVTAATVNWVTQTSFDPPLIAVGIKAD